jgi:hypothetical protein
MAFNPNYLKLWSVNNVPAVVNANIASNANPIPNLWGYKTSDAIATVTASGYFKNFGNPKFNDIKQVVLKVGDQIWCNCSDGGVNIFVNALNPTRTTVSNNPIGANTVTTAMIQNLAITTALINTGAVTTAKIADAAVTSAKLDPTTIQYAAVALTSAQIKAMYTTPVQIIAAPTAGKLIRIKEVTVDYSFLTAQYTGGGVTNLQYDSTANGAGTAASATIAAATINAWAANNTLGLAGDLADSASTTTVGKGIYISNKTGVFATGSGTINLVVAYNVFTF